MSKEWREKNREKIRIESRKYYYANKESRRKYRKKNVAHFREYARRYREKNRAHLAKYHKKYCKKYWEKNRDRINEYRRKWSAMDRARNRSTYCRRFREWHRKHTETLQEFVLDLLTKKGETKWPKYLQQMERNNPQKFRLLIAREKVKLLRKIGLRPDALRSLKKELIP